MMNPYLRIGIEKSLFRDKISCPVQAAEKLPFSNHKASVILGTFHCGGAVCLSGSAFQKRFQKNLNFFFCFEVLCFWCFQIILMCWSQKWFLKNKKTLLTHFSEWKALWKATTTTTTLQNTKNNVLTHISKTILIKKPYSNNKCIANVNHMNLHQKQWRDNYIQNKFCTAKVEGNVSQHW